MTTKSLSRPTTESSLLWLNLRLLTNNFKKKFSGFSMITVHVIAGQAKCLLTRTYSAMTSHWLLKRWSWSSPSTDTPSPPCSGKFFDSFIELCLIGILNLSKLNFQEKKNCSLVYEEDLFSICFYVDKSLVDCHLFLNHFLRFVFF